MSVDKPGTTLAELLAALTIAGIVLSLLAGVSSRQQRAFADLGERNAVAARLRDGSGILPIDLRSVSPSGGDLRDARDTSLEIRATIATGVVCDTAVGQLALVPMMAATSGYGGILVPLEAGDSAWILSVADSGETWVPYAVSAPTTRSSGGCAAGAPVLDASDEHLSSVFFRPVPAVTGTLPGMPVRVTRPLRYSLYRASDGAWYLGAKEWNNSTSRFNGIQPVAGPFLSAAAGGLVFTYADSTGALLPTPVADPRVVTLVGIQIRAQAAAPTRSQGLSRGATRRDSVFIAIALRNR